LKLRGPPSINLSGTQEGVNDLAFSPDGTVLASGGNDAVARFWDLNTGQVLGLMIGGTFAVPSIAFSPDGSVLAVANGEMIRLRQVGSERILGSFQSDEPLFSLAYSPDGAWLAAGDTRNQVLLWKPEQAFRTGQENYPDPIRLEAHDGRVGTFRSLIWDVTFSPDNQLPSAGRITQSGCGILKVPFCATLHGHTAGVTSVKFNNQTNALLQWFGRARLRWKIEPAE
jgi:WD40 repeat protein